MRRDDGAEQRARLGRSARSTAERVLIHSCLRMMCRWFGFRNSVRLPSGDKVAPDWHFEVTSTDLCCDLPGGCNYFAVSERGRD